LPELAVNAWLLLHASIFVLDLLYLYFLRSL